MKCVFLMLTFRVTNASSGMRECGAPAEWVRTWAGGERHYCDDHKKLLICGGTIKGDKWAPYVPPIKLKGAA